MVNGKDIKDKVCILEGCSKRAVAFCNNCWMPICNVHGKRINQTYLCVNCLKYTKKAGLR